VSSSAEEWRATTLKKALERAPERDDLFETTSHIPLQPAYTSEDLRDWDERERLAYPGEYPYTRGTQATMFAGGCGRCASTPAMHQPKNRTPAIVICSNAAKTGLSIAFDLPTQMGYDADHPLAEGEVGKVGVSITSLRRYGAAAGWPAARQSHHVDDDQLDRGDLAGALHRGRKRGTASIRVS